MNMLIEAYKKHKQWCEIVESFGCNKETAEDLVQEMYLKLHALLESGLDVKYDETINYYYIYKILRTLFLDLKRKEKRVTYTDEAELYLLELQADEDMIGDKTHKEIYRGVMDTLDDLYWYDRKVFELLDGEMSVSELSRNTGISYYSLYNTYKKVKQILKEKLL
jgi:RNA polymerase sigma factor (sigma-70 family)